MGYLASLGNLSESMLGQKQSITWSRGVNGGKDRMLTVTNTLYTTAEVTLLLDSYSHIKSTCSVTLRIH